MKFSIKDYVVLYPKKNGRWHYKAFKTKAKAYQFLEKNSNAVLVRWQVGKGKKRFPPRDTYFEAEQELFKVEDSRYSCGIYVAEPDKHLPDHPQGESCSPWLMYYSVEFHDQVDYVKWKGGSWVPKGSEADLKAEQAWRLKNKR